MRSHPRSSQLLSPHYAFLLPVHARLASTCLTTSRVVPRDLALKRRTQYLHPSHQAGRIGGRKEPNYQQFRRSTRLPIPGGTTMDQSVNHAVDDGSNEGMGRTRWNAICRATEMRSYDGRVDSETGEPISGGHLGPMTCPQHAALPGPALGGEGPRDGGDHVNKDTTLIPPDTATGEGGRRADGTEALDDATQNHFPGPFDSCTNCGCCRAFQNIIEECCFRFQCTTCGPCETYTDPASSAGLSIGIRGGRDGIRRAGDISPAASDPARAHRTTAGEQVTTAAGGIIVPRHITTRKRPSPEPTQVRQGPRRRVATPAASTLLPADAENSHGTPEQEAYDRTRSPQLMTVMVMWEIADGAPFVRTSYAAGPSTMATCGCSADTVDWAGSCPSRVLATTPDPTYTGAGKESSSGW